MMSQILRTIFEFLEKVQADPPETQPRKNDKHQSSGNSAANKSPAAGPFNNTGTLIMKGAINNSGHMDGNCNGSIMSSIKEVIKKSKSEVKDFPPGFSNSGTMILMGGINNLGRTQGYGNGSIIVSDEKWCAEEECRKIANTGQPQPGPPWPIPTSILPANKKGLSKNVSQSWMTRSTCIIRRSVIHCFTLYLWWNLK